MAKTNTTKTDDHSRVEFVRVTGLISRRERDQIKAALKDHKGMTLQRLVARQLREWLARDA